MSSMKSKKKKKRGVGTEKVERRGNRKIRDNSEIWSKEGKR